jgi:Leucine-rich repeat (LRR) protein
LDLTAKFSSPSVPDIVWQKGDAVVDLSLAKNALPALPAQIESFTRLRKLSLNDNKLTTLPLELGKCALLEELFLQKNALAEIPVVVFELTRLTELDIRCAPV